MIQTLSSVIRPNVTVLNIRHTFFHLFQIFHQFCGFFFCFVFVALFTCTVINSLTNNYWTFYCVYSINWLLLLESWTELGDLFFSVFFLSIKLSFRIWRHFQFWIKKTSTNQWTEFIWNIKISIEFQLKMIIEHKENLTISTAKMVSVLSFMLNIIVFVSSEVFDLCI